MTRAIIYFWLYAAVITAGFIVSLFIDNRVLWSLELAVSIGVGVWFLERGWKASAHERHY